jgi:phage tail sheath gpL-like
MGLDANSLASAVGSGVENVTHQTAAEVLQRKIVITGVYDAAKTAVVDEVPVFSADPAFTGSVFGFGTPVHRLHLKAALGAQGIETWIQPQAETGTESDGEIDFTGSTGVLAGTLAIYIAGDRIPVTITAAMTVEEIADAVVAAVNADLDTPVIAAKTAVTFEVTLTAKTKGLEGDFYDISLDLLSTDTLPTGITAAITAMTNGAGTPDIADALNGLGIDDNANEAGFTELIHGYGQVSAVLDAISTYVGEGNGFTGLYAKTVARPFRSLTGDTVADAAGLAAQIVISDARLDDRSQGVVSVPGSQSAPTEIAAQTLGHMARINNNRAEEAYNNVTLIGVQPGATADRWTSSYDSRDTAVKAGISPTLVQAGVVKLQNVVSFYRPASVPVTSNGYREMVNISKLQNILNSQKVNFLRDKWQNISIVTDTAKVTNTVSRLKARDINSVLDDLIQLVTSWAGNAWIADADFTIGKLKADSSLVVIRTGGDGFTITIPVILSGIGNIYDVTTRFDISFAVLNN